MKKLKLRWLKLQLFLLYVAAYENNALLLQLLCSALIEILKSFNL